MTSGLERLVQKLRNRTAAFAHDLCMIPIAWLGAYWLRFNLDAIPEPIQAQALTVLPVVLLVQGAVFWGYGLYRGVWRFASMQDLTRIIKAAGVGVAMCAIVLFILTRLEDIPRSVFPLFALLLVASLVGPRLVYRLVKDRGLRLGDGPRALVVGAGVSGEALVRDLLRDPGRECRPVAFVDDDYAKKGTEIHGVRVLGDCAKIPRLVSRLGVDLVLVAIPSATADQRRRVVRLCESAGVPVRSVPTLQAILSGEAAPNELREISIDDLLGRDPVSLDWTGITRTVSGRVILVTGGGGSIGSELCRQLARLGPRALVVVDNGERQLFEIDRELRRTCPGVAVHPVLRDVTDRPGVEATFARFRPDVVFHAAAYKHVPLLEGHPREAARNNVLGTITVAEAASASGCASFVLISTDKAVNPVNMLGASKRVAELVCLAASRRSPGTRFVTVRFGNVLDSAGSVVPVFREQIARGGPVTVTHPDVTRYFMTIVEACELILQAATIGNSGEVLVLDMGDPVRIDALAREMIRLAGKIPDEEIEVVTTGLRPGEKLHEELFHAHERTRTTGHAKIRLAAGDAPDRPALEVGLAGLVEACGAPDEEAVARALWSLLPGRGPGETERVAADNVIPLGDARPR